jgi:Zn-dependent protease with chaperone function
MLKRAKNKDKGSGMKAGRIWITLFFVGSTAAGCAVDPELQAIRPRIQRARLWTNPDLYPVFQAFNELGRAAGIDPNEIYVGAGGEQFLGVSGVGAQHFVISQRVLGAADRCLIWGIVAHELAHDILGHAEKRFVVQRPPPPLSIPIPLFEAGALGRLVLSAYSYSQEEAADDRAVELLRKAGKPAGVMRYALEFLLGVYGDTTTDWFSSHPANFDRIARLPAVGQAEQCPSADQRRASIESERTVWRQTLQRKQ